MRKLALILLVVILAVFTSVSFAQKKSLSTPKRPWVVQGHFRTECVDIRWRMVEGAYSYEVRLTKAGPGKLRYTADSDPNYRKMGWHSWKEFSGYVRYGNSKTYITTVCGLEPGQTIKARVRVVNRKGKFGSSSKASKVFVTS